MSVEGDDVVNTHVYKLLQCQSTVQRFTAGTFVLAALVQERHDHGDPLCLSAYGSNDTFQILEMVIRGHMIGIAVKGVGHVVVAYVNQNVNVISADRFFDDTFGFAGTKTGSCCTDDVAVPLIAFESDVALVLVFPLITPGNQIVVDPITQLFAAFQGNDP